MKARFLKCFFCADSSCEQSTFDGGSHVNCVIMTDCVRKFICGSPVTRMKKDEN